MLIASGCSSDWDIRLILFVNFTAQNWEPGETRLGKELVELIPGFLKEPNLFQKHCPRGILPKEIPRLVEIIKRFVGAKHMMIELDSYESYGEFDQHSIAGTGFFT